MRIIKSDGHTIKVDLKFFGTENIYYEDKKVSSKFSIMGEKHTFTASENGKIIYYEVQVGNSWHGLSGWVEVKKDGKIIYSDKRK